MKEPRGQGLVRPLAEAADTSLRISAPARWAGGVDTLTELIYAGFDSMGALGRSCWRRAPRWWCWNPRIVRGGGEPTSRPGCWGTARPMTPTTRAPRTPRAAEPHWPCSTASATRNSAPPTSTTSTRTAPAPTRTTLRSGQPLRQYSGTALGKPHSSTKSQMDHTLSAAGAIEAMAAAAGADFVQQAGHRAPLACALSNFFAFSGHPACLAVGRADIDWRLARTGGLPGSQIPVARDPRAHWASAQPSHG